jgi:hypothetical protein
MRGGGGHIFIPKNASTSPELGRPVGITQSEVSKFKLPVRCGARHLDEIEVEIRKETSWPDGGCLGTQKICKRLHSDAEIQLL